MAKKTIEEVREFIFNNSNGKCELLSEEYVNKKTPLKIKCGCGNVFERKWENLNKDFVQCKECTNEYRSEKYSFSRKQIIDAINSTGCKYIGGEYVNNRSLLTIQCRCGNVFKKDYARFSSGANRCPECGNENTRKSKIKYSIQDVQEKISEKGYILLETEYLGAHEKMRCKCSKGHEFDLVFSQYLKGCSGCNKCAVFLKSGKTHCNYKNGNSKVSEALRNTIDTWKKRIAELYDNKCPITGDESDLVVHHIVSFSVIVRTASEKCGVPVLKRIKEYDQYEDFAKLKDEIVLLHNSEVGILISGKIHSLFHRKYGAEATKDDFIKFLKEDYNTDLCDIIRNSPIG